MYKKDLALNNLQCHKTLICHKTQPNTTKSNHFSTYSYMFSINLITIINIKQL